MANDPHISGYTLPKFNIAPENIPSQKESSLPTIIFMLNFGGVMLKSLQLATSNSPFCSHF